MDKRINGFTLIEMLLTIGILGLLSFIVVPSIYKSIERQELVQFFNVLESDVFYIQNQALGTRKNFRIIFDEDYYIIAGPFNSGIDIKRYYPKHLKQEIKINHRVTFTSNGTVSDSTKVLFNYRDTTYQLVFPLGKGRYYIEEK